MKNNNSLIQGPIAPALVKFTVPFLLATLLQTLYGTVDVLVVGNFGSTAGVSAVATGSQVLTLVTFTMMGLTTGSTVMLGQYLGAGNHKQTVKTIGTAIITFAVTALVAMVLLLFAYPMILDLLNVPVEAVEEARRYTFICTLGVPLMVGYNTVCAILRGMGDSKSPLLFVGVACVVNIAGDLLLTGALGMGAAGVAIATVAAQGVSFVFGLFYTMKKGLGFTFTKADIRADKALVGRIFTLGIPLAVQSIMVNLSFMFITSIINALGVTASAAMGVGDKLVGFAFLPQTAFSSSVAVVSAQNIGAGKPERAMQSVKISMGICLAIEFLFFLVCQIWPTLLPGMFSHDPAVLEMAGDYMRAYSYDALLTSIIFPISGLLNGCGHTTFNMTQNLLTTFLVRVPATWLFSRMAGVTLFRIGLASPLASIISVLIVGYYIIKGKWKEVPSRTETPA